LKLGYLGPHKVFGTSPPAALIDSTNLDKLVGSALPRVGKQIDNFLKWMSVELGDDQMGLVQLPEDLDHLAGLVGAVDGERVQALLSVMQKEGLIERPSDNRVRLTMAAWNRLDQPQNAAQAIETSLFHIGRRGSAEEEAFPLEAGATIRAHCRNCGPNTKAVVLARYIGGPDDEDQYDYGYDVTVDDYRILKCKGCEAVYVQRVSLTFDPTTKMISLNDFHPKTGEYNPELDPTTTYWPAPSRRKPPVWLVYIQDQVLRGLLEEVYEAMDADLRSIAAMGIRAALDRTFELAGADPAHGFAQKLAALKEQNVIGAEERELLLIMTDAGSAASHRGWKPEPEELDSILAATEDYFSALPYSDQRQKK
jgi:Domain of unknown function (DUF4145)